jgi:hypothetical protein
MKRQRFLKASVRLLYWSKYPLQGFCRACYRLLVGSHRIAARILCRIIRWNTCTAKLMRTCEKWAGAATESAPAPLDGEFQ